MSPSEITVGIIARSKDVRDVLSSRVKATGLATVITETDQYCAAKRDQSTCRMVQAQPNIIFVELEDEKAAIETLNVLSSELPEPGFLSPPNGPILNSSLRRCGPERASFFPRPFRLMVYPRLWAGTLVRGSVTGTKTRLERSTALLRPKVAAVPPQSQSTSPQFWPPIPDTRVALIDLNSPVGDVAGYLNLKPQFTVSDVFAASSRLDAVLLETYMSHFDGAALLPGPSQFQTGQTKVESLSKMLEVVREAYTHTIIDLPSYLNRDAVEVLTEMSAAMVIVLTPELPALWRSDRLLRFLESCGGTEKVRLVVNRSDKRGEITNREIEKVLNRSVSWRLPDNYSASMRAINSGRPLVTRPHLDLARQYHELAHQLTGITPPKKRGGVFGLFA